MFEVLVVGLLCFISWQLRKSKPKHANPKADYFPEAAWVTSDNVSFEELDLLFYTAAEFSERSRIESSGLFRELGFSYFSLVYDSKANKFRTATVKIVSAEGYGRGRHIGYCKNLSKDEGRIEVKIQLLPREYDAFLQELREAAAERRGNGEKKYFLFSISGNSVLKIGETEPIKCIDSISKIGAYESYYADKNQIMIHLKSGVASEDPSQAHLCSKMLDRFNELNK